MKINWITLKASGLCHFKAWSLSREKANDLEFSLHENIIHLSIPVDDITAIDRTISLAWYHARDDLPKENIDRLRMHAGESTDTILLKKPTAKSTKLYREAIRILGNSEPPAFYRNAHCRECHLNDSCSARLKERDCLSQLGGISMSSILKYHSKGIFTIFQLSHLFRPRRKSRRLDMSGHYPFELKALAIREQKTFVLNKPQINQTSASIYLDMEGLPSRNMIYLIGGLICSDGKVAEEFSFWANDEAEQGYVFEKLFQLFSQYPGANVFHYGSYDIKAIRSFDKEKFALMEHRMINVLGFMRKHVFPPTYTNSLKEIAGYLGFRWSDREATGLLSIEWRRQWELTGADIWKEKLIRYNFDDCKALIAVERWLRALSSGGAEAMQVADMKAPSPFKFHRNPEFGLEYTAIAKAAYFNYQQDKIYWRGKSGKRKTKSKPHGKGRGRPTWRPTKLAHEIALPKILKCPYCGCEKIHRSHARRKFRQTDLKFTSKGITHEMTEYSYGRGKCTGCGRTYNDNTLAKMIFGNNLMAWAINMYVDYHISHGKITRMLWEQFGVWAEESYLLQRKSEWFEKFGEETDYLWKMIKQSPVIHIDETSVKLVKENGHVWVFATAHTVTYHYSAKRETDFLKERLEGYTGVVVTDFYPGYETLPFKRQKCLVHLIRDLNDDLFKNPFDQAFSLLVKAFGKLMSQIVATIDLHGLRQRHLNKHISDTAAFRKEFLAKNDASELYAKHAKRLIKHWDHLWMFLFHDDVPWNNNSAEAAVKAFAAHRRGANGRMTEKPLREYLKMLGLAQTCRYRKISFLDYLRRKTFIWQNVPAAVLPEYVPEEQQKLFAIKKNFRTEEQWTKWNGSSKRPAFISPEYFFIRKENEWKIVTREKAVEEQGGA